MLMLHDEMASVSCGPEAVQQSELGLAWLMWLVVGPWQMEGPSPAQGLSYLLQEPAEHVSVL